jgi:hypothetical protein
MCGETLGTLNDSSISRLGKIRNCEKTNLFLLPQKAVTECLYLLTNGSF